MKTEIEKKFLVRDGGFKDAAVSCRHLVQGYLCRESGRTVRVRIDDDKAWLTVKGRSTADGTSRLEWEYGIPVEEAREMLRLCPGKLIDKDRYIIPAQYGAADGGVEHSGMAAGERGAAMCSGAAEGSGAAGGPGESPARRFWEVDVFHGAHEGLIVAEIELGSPDEAFARPSWLGEEVTGDRRYYNSVLSGE